MSRLLFLTVICIVVGCAIAAIPTRPVISPIFHADVSVALRDGTKSYRGGGVYAFDTKTNRARIDYKLEDDNQREHYMYIHFLERYDLGAEFEIDDQKCTKTKVTGQLDNPWAWVEQASFIGTGTYRGQSYDEWRYVEGNETTRISVLSSDTTKPVFQSTHSITGNVVIQFDITFEEFDTKEPEDWVFYIPQICNYTNVVGGVVGGDVNAVVYFANNNWNCANVACTSRVAAGTGQPGYQCAEFAARSLAAGSYIPGLTSTSPQASYGNYKGNNLLLVTGLAKALSSLGFKSVGSTNAAYAVFGDGGDGAWSHACIGVGAGTVDCHNNARKGNTATGIMFKGINEILEP